METTPTVISPETPTTTNVAYRVGSLEGVNAGWFGYRPKPDYKKSYYSDELGPFFYASWEHCRDRVQIISRKQIEQSGLWFAHRKNAGKAIRVFFKKLERQLKVKPRSSFEDTEHPEQCIWMNVSPWWMENLVRRSFLTLALRSAQNYKLKKDNFLESFEKNKYGKESMTSIKLFLDGYTNYRGKRLHMFEGWNKLFKAKDEDVFKRVMFRRSSKNNVSQDKADW